MIHYPEYTVFLPPSCPTNRDRLNGTAVIRNICNHERRDDSTIPDSGCAGVLWSSPSVVAAPIHDAGDPRR